MYCWYQYMIQLYTLSENWLSAKWMYTISFSFISRHNRILSIVDTIGSIFQSFEMFRIGKINLWSDIIWNVVLKIQQRISFAFSLEIQFICIIISRSIRTLIMILGSVYIITCWMIIWWCLMVCKWRFINTQS